MFHGTNVNDIASKLVVISQVNGGTIALIGVSPVGPVGMQKIGSPVDAAQYGPSVFDGRTIPHALDAIFAQGAGNVIVINCFKPGHLTQVTAEATAVGDGLKVPLAYVPVGALTVKTIGEDATTLSPDDDYTYSEGDKFFIITNKADYPKTTALAVDYKKLNPDAVVPADIIGTIAVDGTRSGMQLLDAVYSTYGITPKIIIAPVYIEQNTVLTALAPKLAKLRARVIVDAPAGTTVAQAITSRGDAGPYANFDNSDKRMIAVYPYVYKPDPLAPKTVGQSFPLSPYYAGVWAAAVAKYGIQQSPSNLNITGISKLFASITCGISDPDSDAQALNAVGVSTVYSGFAAGLKLWGNRNMSFPSSSDISTFIGVQLVQDVLDESVAIASIAFQDQPLNLALIDTILSSVNGFINTLINSGALIDGSASYDPAKNTPDQLATGKITIDISYLPPTAAEDIEFESFIDISLFNKLNQ
jgi:phage tail sheath protein FI